MTAPKRRPVDEATVRDHRSLARVMSDMAADTGDIVGQLSRFPLASGRAITNQAVTAGTPLYVSHGLGRAYQGYLVTRMQAGSGGVSYLSRRIPIDQYVALCWSVDGSVPLSNTGSLAGGALNTSSGTVNAGRTGLFSTCIEVAGGSSFIRTSDSSSLNPSSSTQLSVHGWVRPNSAQDASSFGRLIAKWFATNYLPAGAPDSFAIAFNISGTQVYAQVYNGGVNKATTASAATAVPLNQWSHVGVTFNSGTVKIYINGNLVLTDATFPASISWNGASGGYWSLGGGLAANTGVTDSDLDEWRVDSGVVRSQSYFQYAYQLGIGNPHAYGVAETSMPAGKTTSNTLPLIAGFTGTIDLWVY